MGNSKSTRDGIFMIPYFHKKTQDRTVCTQCCELCRKFSPSRLHNFNGINFSTCILTQCNECSLCSDICCISCQKMGLTIETSSSRYVKHSHKEYLIFMCNNCLYICNDYHGPKDQHYQYYRVYRFIRYSFHKQFHFQEVLKKMIHYIYLPNTLNIIIWSYCSLFEFTKYELNIFMKQLWNLKIKKLEK